MTYDYIIAGAGCAGLSLAMRMAGDSFFDNKRILLIDCSPKTQNDRTWCFWSESDFGYQSATKQSWKTLEFKSDKTTKSESISPYTYYHLKSSDYYAEAKSVLNNKPNFTWVKEQISDLVADQNGVSVLTRSQTYKADLVFNSICDKKKLTKASGMLWQHFYGYTIDINNVDFAHRPVTLMDFSLSDNEEYVQFGYILPFEDGRVLIEYTEFSHRQLEVDEYEELLSNYLKKLGIDNYSVLEKEHGRIPMSQSSFKRRDRGIIYIGTAGGMTKPTTGYTFRNIQLDSARIVSSLKTGEPKTTARGHQRFNFYDRLLLGIIKDEPSKVKPIMTSLFKRNKTRNILKFLDEQTSILEEIRIFLSIPWAPFLRQLIKK